MFETKCIFPICLLLVTTIAVDAEQPFDSKVSGLIINQYKGNVVFSPLAIRAALMLNSLGVQKPRAENLRNVLNLNHSLNLVVTELEKILTGIKSSDVEIKVGSRVFMAQTEKPNPRLSLLGDDLQWVNFTETYETHDLVNEWLFSIGDYHRIRMWKPFPVKSTGQLVNKLFFKARWLAKSSGVDGEKMIHHTGTFLFSDQIKSGTAAVVVLPFRNTSIVMLVAAPKQEKDLKKLERFLTHTDLTKFPKRLRPTNMRVGLPYVQWSARVNLKPVYRALKVGGAFRELGLSGASHFAELSIDDIGINIRTHSRVDALIDGVGANVSSTVPTDGVGVGCGEGVYEMKYNSSFFFAIMDANNVYLAGHIKQNDHSNDYYDANMVVKKQ